MQCKFLLLSAFLFIAISCQAGDSVNIDYRYTKDPGVDFSQMSRGPLKVAAFSDSRNRDSNKIKIIDAYADKHTSVATKNPVSETVTSAFSQAFIAGGAKLVDSDEKLLLTGNLLELDINKSGDTYEVSIKTDVTLQNNGKKVWGNTLITKAGSPQSTGIDGAVTAALDKLISDFFYDDYFLMEVVD